MAVEARLDEILSTMKRYAENNSPANLKIAGLVGMSVVAIALAIFELAQAIRSKSFS